MRRQIQLSALSLLFISGEVLAETKNCLIIMMGGAKEWTSLINPLRSTDISILVDHAAMAEAKRTGCRILHGSNQSKEEFQEMIKKAGKPPYFMPGTTVHLSLNDHGTPQENIQNDYLVTGNRQFISNADMAKLLKESFPQGTRLTYASSICWGSLSEMGIAFGLDSHFDYCGSSSTHPREMSTNTSEVVRNKSGIIEGPYVAAVLGHSADRVEKNFPFPRVSSAHAWSRKSDVGNLFKVPGFLSSTSYARLILKKHVLQAEIDNSPFLDLIKFNTLGLTQLEKSESNVRNDIFNMIQNGKENCTLTSDPKFHGFILAAEQIYASLVAQIPDNLPEPYKTQSLEASRYFKQNKKQLSDLLVNHVKGNQEFWARNKDRLLDPSQSRALYVEWDKVIRQLGEPLKQFIYHARTIQEGKTVSDFLKIAKPEEKARFNKFLQCESRPLL